MTVRKHLAAAAALAGVAMLAGCTGPAEPEPTPTPKATAVIGEPTPVDPFDPVGQPADGGAFEPLTVPDGMPHGTDVEVPGQWLTTTGSVPAMRTLVTVQLPGTDGAGTPVVLLSLDQVTEPISGDERNWVLNNEGINPAGDVVVQQIIYRLREVATDGTATATWSPASTLVPLNNLGEAMLLRPYDESPFACHGASYPFDGHSLETNDTVQVCAYVIGDISFNPSAWLNAVQVRGEADGEASPVVIRSDIQQPLVAGGD
ncbi:hypothetical protein [Microbacterium gorillae]|uniref:hypothetical protein n=1 Tax=Microbacterium gorillae TaxID=1231063 RepID=UPI003D99B687